MIGLALAAWLFQAQAAAPPPLAPPTTAESFLALMQDPEIAAIIARRAPAYLRLLEQQVVGPPSAEITLDDFAHMPETGVTPEILKAINRDLADLARRREVENRRQ